MVNTLILQELILLVRRSLYWQFDKFKQCKRTATKFRRPYARTYGKDLLLIPKICWADIFYFLKIIS